MPHDKLIVESCEPLWAVLRVIRDGETADQSWLPLTSDFTVDDVAEALLATGWVQRGADHQLVSAGKSCRALGDVVTELFTYFVRRNEPRAALLRVQEAVAEYESVRELAPRIPLWAYAWLDLVVREDLADEARSAQSVWEQRPLTLRTQEHCDRRVQELVARYAETAAKTGRMTPSRRSRSTSVDAANRAG